MASLAPKVPKSKPISAKASASKSQIRLYKEACTFQLKDRACGLRSRRPSWTTSALAQTDKHDNVSIGQHRTGVVMSKHRTQRQQLPKGLLDLRKFPSSHFPLLPHSAVRSIINISHHLFSRLSSLTNARAQASLLVGSKMWSSKTERVLVGGSRPVSQSPSLPRWS